jgi:hypothetical protein
MLQKEAGKGRDKQRWRHFPLFFSQPCKSLFTGLLARFDCFDRALLGTRAAVRAELGIDHVLVVALADRVHGADTLTGTTGNALIGNRIRHFSILLQFLI